MLGRCVYITGQNQFKLWLVPAVVGSIVVVGALPYCALLHCVCDLKSSQMNMQFGLIWEFMFYEFKLGHNDTELIKNIWYVKGEGAVDCTVTRWFKKFFLGCKNLNDQAKSCMPKTVDSKTMLQAIETNLVSSTQRLSGKLSILQSSVVCYLHWCRQKHPELLNCLTLPKYCKTFDSSKYF